MKNSKIFVFVVFLFLLTSCAEKKEENYIVKVGDSYLTETMIDESLSFTNDAHKFRKEFIREWIETELIYLDALDNGVVDSEEYQKLLNNAKIEIANAIAIKKIISENSVVITNNELENFYFDEIAEFKVVSRLLIYNKATFSSRNDAVHFRRMIIRKGWKNSINYFTTNGIQISVKQNISDYEYNIINENLKNQLSLIDEREYSSIVEISKNIFVIIELVKRYNKNDVPEFNEIKNEVEQKYISFKRKELYNNYLKELYSKYSSEIER